jgi:hypothetical protein
MKTFIISAALAEHVRFIDENFDAAATANPELLQEAVTLLLALAEYRKREADAPLEQSNVVPFRRRASMKRLIAIGLVLALWVGVPAIAQTDSGLPPAPPPEEVKPDGMGAGSPDKRFWINPEDERRKAQNKPSPAPAPAANVAPVTPEEMQRMSRRLDLIEQRLESLEAAPKPAAAAPSPEPQRRQKAQQPPPQRPLLCRTEDGLIVPCQLLRRPLWNF